MQGELEGSNKQVRIDPQQFFSSNLPTSNPQSLTQPLSRRSDDPDEVEISSILARLDKLKAKYGEGMGVEEEQVRLGKDQSSATARLCS